MMPMTLNMAIFMAYLGLFCDINGSLHTPIGETALDFSSIRDYGAVSRIETQPVGQKFWIHSSRSMSRSEKWRDFIEGISPGCQILSSYSSNLCA